MQRVPGLPPAAKIGTHAMAFSPEPAAPLIEPVDQTAAHARSLDALARRNRLRALQPRHGIDFTSNDYLGLAASGLLQKAASDALARGVEVGSGGSRLLRGNSREHEALETEATALFGNEAALFFSSGFAANAAILASLPQRGDLVVYDALSHASTREGLALTRADARAAAHNEVAAFDDAIQAWRRDGGTGRVWIAVESIYSMDGDAAPLADFQALGQRHEAFLIIDEAHATGVLGPGGRGLAAALPNRDAVITLHTCGKALGAEGALVCGPRVLIDVMINRARAFIYSTAPSPLIAAIVRACLFITKFDADRRARLADHVALVAKELGRHCDVAISGSHIQPVIIGSDARAVAIAERLQRNGFDIRAIRPPTVPEGTARLRLAITLNVTADDITNMADHLGRTLAETPA